MGMNYYSVKKRTTCREPIHIGKSSYGWLFNFQDNEYWHTYPQVKQWLKDNTTKEDSEYVIIDEEDRIVTYEEFIQKVEDKQNDPKNLANPDNFTYAKNIDGYRFSEGYFS